MRSVDGVGLFVVAVSALASKPPQTASPNRRPLVGGAMAFFFMVLNANGDAAPKRSCVLIGAPGGTLPFGKAPSNRLLYTENGVVSGLVGCTNGRGDFFHDGDHSRASGGESVRYVLSWNSSCASNMAACVDMFEG